jgi:hypothetical protein
MGRGGADHAVIGLAQRGQRQRIGRRAVEHEEHLAIAGEQGAEGIGGAARPCVVAIGDRGAVIGRGHGGQRFGADARIVVAGELLGFCGCHSMLQS